MIRPFVFAVWVVAITLGGVYAGQALTSSSGISAAGKNGSYGIYKTELMGFPYVGDRGVVGYATARFTVKTDPAAVAASRLPIELVVHDALNRHFYEKAGTLSRPSGWSNLRESMAEVRELANRTAGRKIVSEVMIEQLDFFNKDEVRMPSDSR
ncbi:hypothetical protein [Oricola cellulosilytica]|uniref:Flagellar basal body-associated protein FliL n=1 Tax=Oricola cellulosilytica TaxID=1429082 RepID=A0A4R0PF37_9HYPH|nr:hypothetical protein [Oricola cellulosilytica]TCD16231.1 hypothetical protein E0D97_02020 [Oricola cellulosilytica]